MNFLAKIPEFKKNSGSHATSMKWFFVVFFRFQEFWPNSDLSSNGSVPRRSNLSTQCATRVIGLEYRGSLAILLLERVHRYQKPRQPAQENAQGEEPGRPAAEARRRQRGDRGPAEEDAEEEEAAHVVVHVEEREVPRPGDRRRRTGGSLCFV